MITEQERAVILAILAQHVPGCRVLAFGSRCTGRHKPYSDLDLAVIAPAPLPLTQWGLLGEAFEASGLPYRVDVVDYRSASATFRAIIDEINEVLVA
ncbi:MAG: nucleotidyltransferase domain-containing protein [Oscillospiraceae bacterium]|nr:nucleotidyltransferase domain-containing protein [Oscillospiraceae bacterium]